MNTSLRIHEPDFQTADPADPFRCDDATVSQVLDWFELDTSRSIGTPTVEKECRRNRRICRESLGKFLVRDCRPFHLLALINAQPRIKSDWTRRRWNSSLQAPFKRAEDLGLIVKNPFRGLSFPAGDEGRDWTDEEFVKIIEAANEPFGELILGLRLSGMRPLEGCGLQWPHIRFDAGDIRFHDHKTRHHTKADRCFPLNDPLIALFNRIKARNHPGGHVFRNTKNRRWIRSHADSNFRRLRERLGLPDDVVLHGCRHTFGTQAIMAGLDIAIVAQLLGHSSLETTKRYVHLVNKVDHLAGAMNQAVSTLKVRTVKLDANPTPLFDGLE